MKKFFFKLDSVLKYREHQEKKARTDLSDAKKAWLETQNLVEGLVERKEENLAQLRIDAMQGMAASWYMECQNYVRRLDDELELARNDLEKQNRIVEEKRAFLKREYMKKESLGMLKISYKEKHEKWVEMEEQKNLDEMILIRRGGLH